MLSLHGTSSLQLGRVVEEPRRICQGWGFFGGGRLVSSGRPGDYAIVVKKVAARGGCINKSKSNRAAAAVNQWAGAAGIERRGIESRMTATGRVFRFVLEPFIAARRSAVVAAAPPPQGSPPRFIIFVGGHRGATHTGVGTATRMTASSRICRGDVGALGVVGSVASFRSAASAAASRPRSATAVSAAASSAKRLVVVESPAKAVSVQKYLGDEYKVLASYGHVRDLIRKSGSVRPEEDFAMSWAENAKGEVMRDIVRAAKDAEVILLATDPDREGEAISWHIVELLKEKGLVSSSSSSSSSSSAGGAAAAGALEVKRVTFTEVTKSAVQEAFASPREMDDALIQAYLARRALDYLFGFNLSGVLWRKLPSTERLSAGRVQSVALRLVCERELEIERHVKEEYWSVFADLLPPASGGSSSSTTTTSTFTSELTHVGGERLGKMEPSSRVAAEEAAAAIVNCGNRLTVHGVTEKDVKRRPKPPFTTSTLQQDASSRLGFGSGRTMSAAQALYEGRGWGEGLITYMRTDGLHVSPAAVSELRHVATSEFGDEYVPSSPNIYKKVQKNAQEAHEAIRPTSAKVLPAAVGARLGTGSDEARLYKLIWARAMSSQMSPAVTKRIHVDIRSKNEEEDGIRLKANGSRLLFPGFLAAYDVNTGSGGGDRWLPALTPGEDIRLVNDEVNIVERDKNAKTSGFGAGAGGSKSAVGNDEDVPVEGDKATATATTSDAASSTGVTAVQHWTQPPPRYTEGSLVKALEEKGIGRPSTYASIMKVIMKRGYVTPSSGRGPLVPEMRGRLVSSFLSHFFDEYVDYGFTAALEDSLDDIANGKEEWKGVLSNFWERFAGEVDSLKSLRTSLVVDVLDATMGVHFFGDDEKTLEAQLKAIEAAAAKAATAASTSYPKLEFDPDSLSETRKCPRCDGGRLGLKLSRTGGFIGCSNYPECGYSRQLEAYDENGSGVGQSGGITFPMTLGQDPATRRNVLMLNGPYGPYLQLEEAPEEDEVAETVIAVEEEEGEKAKKATTTTKKKKKKKTPKPKSFGLKNLDIKPEDVTLDLALELLRYPLVLGLHPDDGEEVVMQMGPFGWYVSHAGLNAALPKKLLRSIREDAVKKAAARGDDGGSFAAEGQREVEVEDEEEKVGEEFFLQHEDDDGEFTIDGDDDDNTTNTTPATATAAAAAAAAVDVSRETREAAVLRAQYCPVSLELAVELITKKRLKPPSEGGRPWGRKKKKSATAADVGSATEIEKLDIGAGDHNDGGDTKKKKGLLKQKKNKKKPKAKRPLSAYMLYCAEARGLLPEGLAAPEQAKLLGAQWKSLDEGKKSKFENLAREAKEAAAAAAAKENNVLSCSKTKAKRTPTAYLLFCSEARKSSESLRGLKVTEQAKELGAAWKSLGEEERSKYQAMARDAKEAAAAAAAS